MENNYERKLLLPPNRDWTKEYYAYRKRTLEFEEIIKFKIENLKGKKINPERFDQELANIYRFSKGMNKVMSDFYQTAKKCVQLINRWNLEPQDVKYLYGVGGKKFVMGGLLIRELDSIIFCQKKYKKPDQIKRFLRHKINMFNYIRTL